MAAKSYRTPLSKRRINANSPENYLLAGLLEIALIEGLRGVSDAPISLDPFQKAFLMVPARRRCIEKSRQVGFSWIMAGEAALRCSLRQAYTGTFLSYNQKEAAEKIRYAKLIIDGLPAQFQKKATEDAKSTLTLLDGAGRSTSRIESVPSRAPRGLGGDVYLDELAHYQRDKDVYAGTTALISRHPRAQLTVCSTPFGRRGTFWEIARQETETSYPGFWRLSVPWWLSRHFCRNPRAARANGVASMMTEDRVRVWGTKPLREQFDSLLLEDFQQEYECDYADQVHSFFPWTLINRCAKDLALYDGSDGWEVHGRLVAGFDVGRRRDVSAMTIAEEIDGHYFIRYLNMWERMPFDDQEELIRECLRELPIARLRIDENGIGMNLAETMVKEFGADRVQPIAISQPAKELMATDVKVMMDKGQLTIPKHRDLLTQTHAIRKKVGEGGRPIFDVETNAKHHGDLFWSMAIGVHRERKGSTQKRPAKYRARVAG